jgi:putative flippase GtrA
VECSTAAILAVVVVRRVWQRHLHRRSVAGEVVRFGAVGALNYVIDVSIFNALVVGPLDNKPVTAKAISTIIALTSSYFLNRHWTWAHRARTGIAREYSLFLVLSAVGLGLTLAALAFGEYVLDQHSLVARNIWGNIVGVGLASVFRFWSFKRWVFLGDEHATAEAAEATVRTTV